MINSIETLLCEIEEVKKKHPGCSLYFRGQTKKYPSVTPSIGRDDYLQKEDLLFREYILRNPNEFQGENTTFEKLVKMQHYKLPTRLLDITSNPLVALFFAVQQGENETDDGDFIVFPIPEKVIKYYDSDTVSVVSNVARRPFNKLDISGFVIKTGEKPETFKRRFNKAKPIQYLLHEIKEEKPYFKDVIVRDHLESIWCVKPLLKNRRIVKQDGAFLLFGISGSKQKLADYTSFKPIEIPVKCKPELRNVLNLLGMSKDKLYPELDTTAEHLKVIYGPTPP